MAHTLSALKRLRQGEKRHAHNKAIKTRVKTQIKRVFDAIGKKDAAQARALFREACTLLDKAVSKGALHLNNASRRKSRLAMRLSSAFPVGKAPANK